MSICAFTIRQKAGSSPADRPTVSKYWNAYPELIVFKEAIFDITRQPHQLFLVEKNTGFVLAYRFGANTGRDDFWLRGVNWHLLNRLVRKFQEGTNEERCKAQLECKILYKGASDAVSHSYCVTREEYIKLDAAQHHATRRKVGKLPPWLDLTYMPEVLLRKHEIFGLEIMSNAEYDTFEWMKHNG